jgi:hypothetical protein
MSMPVRDTSSYSRMAGRRCGRPGSHEHRDQRPVVGPGGAGNCGRTGTMACRRAGPASLPARGPRARLRTAAAAGAAVGNPPPTSPGSGRRAGPRPGSQRGSTAQQAPHRNPTSPPSGPAPQVPHERNGIPRHTPALLLKWSRKPSRTGETQVAQAVGHPRRGGQGQDRTVDLPLFRRTLVPTELPDLGRATSTGPLILAPTRAVLTGFEPATSTLTGWRALRAALQDHRALVFTSTDEANTTSSTSRAPNGIRTRAAALKGRCPRPLDDGGSTTFAALPVAPAVGGRAPA